MKAKKETKTKDSDMEIVDGIFKVDKKNKKIVGLMCSESSLSEQLVIPEGVEIIGKEAFKHRLCGGHVKSIKFPDSLKRIETKAFGRCQSLTDIQFGNQLECIGSYAFVSCIGLKKVIFPSSLKTIEEKAFLDCRNLKTVVFHEGLQIIEPSAFYECENLSEITLPASLRVIGGGALQYTRKVTVHGDLPYNLMRAISPISWMTCSDFDKRNWPMTVELVTDKGTYFLPKYIDATTAEFCECALNSDMPEKMETMYKYCKAGWVSADTAFAMYMYLLKADKEPCEDLKKYVKRMSKNIVSRLIATGRNSDAAEFIQLGLLTPATLKSLYENMVSDGKNDIAAYLMDAMERKGKVSMRL